MNKNQKFPDSGADKHLDEFKQNINLLRKNSNYDVSFLYDDICQISPKTTKHKVPSVGLVGLTHGDEIIGLHILNEILLRIIEGRISLEGDLYLILANRAAYLKEQRYVEVDLNRVYGGQNSTATHEERQAAKIKPVIDKCDIVVDFHQSIEDTLFPFFILPESLEAYKWISFIAPSVPIIHRAKGKVTTLSTYASSKGKLAVTFEVGGSGVDIYQLELGTNFAERVINNARKVMDKPEGIRQLAPIYSMSHFQDYSEGKVSFTKQYRHFEPVKKGQIIALVDSKEITAPIEGRILLYPAKWFLPDSTVKPDGLFYILQEMQPYPIT